MTANTTEKERAEFQEWALSKWPLMDVRTRSQDGNYADFETRTRFMAWQEAAARRVPAVPVPQGLREAAQRAHDWMDSQADSQSKGNHHSFDLFCLRQERDALAEALAAAPQPPEADHIADTGKMVAATVQMPEPVAYLHPKEVCATTDEYYKSAGWTQLYTEHQVLAILAQHGIEVTP